LIEWAVRELGPEKILFGSDTPVYFAGSQRARIDRANLTARQKRMILRENAVKLFDGKL
jgi:predicted TIM-barrel fold metal-dependent hydrolase